MSNLTVCLFLALFIVGCMKSKFTGESGTRPSDPVVEMPPADESDVDPPTSTITIDDPLTSDTFAIVPVTDHFVNTGHLSKRYSETLNVPIAVQGGRAPIKLSFSMTASKSNPTFTADSLSWRPGYHGTSGYESEVGEYTVSLVAIDATGAEVKESFKITVEPVEWSSSVKSTNDSEMIVNYTIVEKRHPNRRYFHEKTYKSEALNDETCRSFSGSIPLTLNATPTVTETQSSETDDDGVTSHSLQLRLSHDLDDQPLDRTVYLTRLNLLFEDEDKTAKETEGIFIYYAFARCRNSTLSQTDCKKEAIVQGGMDNFFYCSEYVGGEFEAEMKRMYCGIANHNGLTPDEC